MQLLIGSTPHSFELFRAFDREPLQFGDFTITISEESLCAVTLRAEANPSKQVDRRISSARVSSALSHLKHFQEESERHLKTIEEMGKIQDLDESQQYELSAAEKMRPVREEQIADIEKELASLKRIALHPVSACFELTQQLKLGCVSVFRFEQDLELFVTAVSFEPCEKLTLQNRKVVNDQLEEMGVPANSLHHIAGGLRWMPQGKRNRDEGSLPPRKRRKFSSDSDSDVEFNPNPPRYVPNNESARFPRSSLCMSDIELAALDRKSDFDLPSSESEGSPSFSPTCPSYAPYSPTADSPAYSPLYPEDSPAYSPLYPEGSPEPLTALSLLLKCATELETKFFCRQ
jgi:hypothetical protein